MNILCFSKIRELLEESNLQVQLENLSKIGILTFEFVDMPQLVMEVHVFTAMNFEGELRESDGNCIDCHSYNSSESLISSNKTFSFI